MSTPTVDDMRRLRDAHARTHSRHARVLRLLKRGLGWLRARSLLADGATLGPHVVIDGHVRVVAHGRVDVGGRALFLAGPIATELVAHEGGEIVIGERAIINYGVSFEASSSVVVGNGCMFGSYVRITDHDVGQTAPIVIADDVWIAHGAYIGPGVTIGRGAVVAAGAVVTSDVPAYKLAIGNPARTMSLDLVNKKPDSAPSTAVTSAATGIDKPSRSRDDDVANRASTPHDEAMNQAI